VKARLCLAACLMLRFMPLAHAENPAPLIATEVLSGDRMKLSDGRIIRLEAIKAPDAGDLAAQSRAALQKLIINRPVTLDTPEALTLDRYGDTLAEAAVTDEAGKTIFLQAAMLRAGMAFIYPPTGTEPRLADLYKAEDEARHSKLGIWADPAFADIDAATLDAAATDSKADDAYGHFAFVTGKVVNAERVKNFFYLNFGPDWHSDFTVAIAAHDLKNFKKQDIDPKDYAGKILRLRGWIKRDFGPMITVTQPGQIEVISK
jgi:endonuclease YncB( thermonuclease family)